MFFDYDFEYLTDAGDRVFVEVSYEYSVPDPYSIESDWDYLGGFFLENYSVTNPDKSLYQGEISEKEIIRELSARLREDAILDVMLDNEYF